MSNMVLQCKESGEFKPHPEGIYPGVCVDVVEVRKTEPLEKLVWFARKEPDNERQTIQHGG